MLEEEVDQGPETVTLALLPAEISRIAASSIDASMTPADSISFYILRLSRVIVVRPEGVIFIGRNVQTDSWIPQVNLADLDGFARSVSRRHAMIRPLTGGYEIIDLGSTNGSRLDGHRLVANKAYPLLSGAQLTVGQEQLMVIYHPPASG